jgi:hypothetical protein
VSWIVWHEKSEKLASEAHMLARQGERQHALRLFGDAAEAENQALLALDPGKQRTIGITAVSAVSLWFKADQFVQAERLAMHWLASGQLPAFAIEQLRGLVQSIWHVETMRAASVSFLPGQVVVSVRGGKTIVGAAPLDLIVEKVQTVQALFYRTIEFLRDAPHRKHGPPSLDIQEACRPWLFQAPPGSYQFSVAIQEPAQADFFKEARPRAEQVAQHFISIVRASSEDPGATLEALVPTADYRATFLKLARNLAPTGKNFSRLEIRGAEDIRAVSLGPENRKAINEVLRPKPDPDQPDTTTVELRGVLRAVHLDNDWLELLVGSESVRVGGVRETVDDTIGPMINRPVIVTVKRTRRGKYVFTDIETDD